MNYLELSDNRIYEFNKLKNWLFDNNQECKVVSKKHIQNNQYLITEDDFADGTIPFIYAILRQVGKQIPVIDSYPLELHKYLGRNVRRTKIKNIYDGFNGFIKPYSSLKAFTGYVIKEPEDHYHLKAFSKNMDVYISEIVNFMTEWRFYVIGKEIVAYGNYDGDENILCDIDIVESAIKDINETPSAFCIDFGVTDKWETLLVEYNDAFSVGWYLDDKWDIYYKLIDTRFKEFIGSYK